MESEILDRNIFDQLVEMDDEEHTFLSQIISNYFEQAESAFYQMHYCLETGDLESLSRLSHSLKGSSASIGLVRMKHACERLQILGKYQLEVDSSVPTEHLIEAAKIELKATEIEYKKVEELFIYFFENR
ncbi:hypothetical protein BB560_004528 [Smittium megazygosporum]|uniref:HPt domain-containing protein n=1 Tax=Smittium megazygosporum TaxID=133381 RepID=A0A2T9Z8Z1_9FUNG|nr:hypothetical protein BB560_004528 [Smittium megazygosporum]